MTERQPSLQQRYAALPLVYACSGCSGAAQLANHFAVRLDREMKAEMSCIAGVGGNVTALVRAAKTTRKILALDGCPLHCVRHCLAQHGIAPDVHVDLSTAGVKKRLHADATADESQQSWQTAVLPALQRLDAIGLKCSQIEHIDPAPPDCDHSMS